MGIFPWKRWLTAQWKSPGGLVNHMSGKREFSSLIGTSGAIVNGVCGDQCGFSQLPGRPQPQNPYTFLYKCRSGPFFGLDHYWLWPVRVSPNEAIWKNILRFSYFWGTKIVVSKPRPAGPRRKIWEFVPPVFLPFPLRYTINSFLVPLYLCFSYRG